MSHGLQSGLGLGGTHRGMYRGFMGDLYGIYYNFSPEFTYTPQVAELCSENPM